MRVCVCVPACVCLPVLRARVCACVFCVCVTLCAGQGELQLCIFLARVPACVVWPYVHFLACMAPCVW